MAHARIPVETRLAFAAIPEKHRAAAKAIYYDAVLLSAELLKNGALSRVVLVEIAADSGIKRPSFVFRSLQDAGLLAATNTGFSIVGWERYHSAREEVEDRRKADAERKRSARGQQQIPGLTPPRPPDVQPDVHEMSERTSRARMRAGGQPTVDLNPKAVTEQGANGAVENRTADDPEPSLQ